MPLSTNDKAIAEVKDIYANRQPGEGILLGVDPWARSPVAAAVREYISHSFMNVMGRGCQALPRLDSIGRHKMGVDVLVDLIVATTMGSMKQVYQRHENASAASAAPVQPSLVAMSHLSDEQFAIMAEYCNMGLRHFISLLQQVFDEQMRHEKKRQQKRQQP